MRLLEFANILIVIGQTLGCVSQQSDNQPSPILDELKKPFTWILDKWHQYNAPEFKRCIRHYSMNIILALVGFLSLVFIKIMTLISLRTKSVVVKMLKANVMWEKDPALKTHNAKRYPKCINTYPYQSE